MLDSDQPRALTIAETEAVAKALDEAVALYPFAEEAYNAAKFRIARDPNIGTLIPGTNPKRLLVLVKSIAIAKSPDILIRYYLKKEKTCDIIIDWVKFFKDPSQASQSPSEYIILGS